MRMRWRRCKTSGAGRDLQRSARQKVRHRMMQREGKHMNRKEFSGYCFDGIGAKKGYTLPPLGHTDSSCFAKQWAAARR